jgi:hypothetical protein
MAQATDYCRACGEALTPGATFCPHCGARVQAPPAGDDRDESRRTWVFVAALVAVVGIVAVVAIALATTSGGGGGNPPGTSVSPATRTTSTRAPATTSRPPVTTSPRST